MGRLGFDVERIDPIVVHGPPQLASHDLMSPFVWRPPTGVLTMLMRLVPTSEHITGRIWCGQSDDGLTFTMDDAPTLSPGPAPLDIRGCEDPTVVPTDGECVVYYTGLDAQGAGQMLYADGPDVAHLQKRGVVMASSKTERNTKEATVHVTADGKWRLFYEYAQNDASLIGVATGPSYHGPWTERPAPFAPRPGHWDNWHLSTGPLLTRDPNRPIMFYNGATRTADWRLGWAAFSRDSTEIVDRCIEPLITPPPAGADGRDIAFAASLITEDDRLYLYYSRNDRKLFRATIRQTEGA